MELTDEERRRLGTLILAMIGILTLLPAMLLMTLMLTTSDLDMPPLQVVGIGIIVVAAIWLLVSTIVSRREERIERARILAERTRLADPVSVAQLHVHDLLPAVREAVASIAALRAVSGGSSLPVVVDAHALADARLPSIMEQLAESLGDATPEESRRLSRQALTSVVSIGDMATRARSAVMEERERKLSIETRYVDERTAPYRGDGLTSID